MAGGGGGAEGEPEFQIAPMIDVLLVLLIFFMSITTTQVLKVDQSINLPLAPDALKKDSMRNEVIINIRWDPAKKKAEYVLNEQVFPDLGDLSKAIAGAKKTGETKIITSDNSAFRVVIRGDRDASALSVSLAMNAAAEAGISDISFSAANKD